MVLVDLVPGSSAVQEYDPQHNTEQGGRQMIVTLHIMAELTKLSSRKWSDSNRLYTSLTS